MNKVILMGRLTKDPDVRYAQNADQTCIARYVLAVDRRYKREGEPNADFPVCVALGKNGEFANKYLRKGTKIVVVGQLQTNSYKNKDGVTVYSTNILVESQEFAESKNAAQGDQQSNQQGYSQNNQNYRFGSGAPAPAPAMDSDGFMQIPDDVDDSALPFN